MVEMFAAASFVADLAPVVQRQPMQVSWHSFDLASGRRGPRLTTQQLGTCSRILCTPTETELSVQIWDEQAGGPIEGWDAATLPGRVMIVALDDDTDEPVWAGLVYKRRSTADTWINISAVTLEAYLDRRYIADQTYTFTSQTMIAAGVVNSVAANGVPFLVDAHTSFRLRDRAYFDDEDKTALSVLTELSSIEEGVEFTVDLQWADDTHTVIQPVLRLADHIGTPSDRPPAAFHLPGNVRGFEYVEDYSSDNGANAVQAVSSGEGDSRPESRWWTPDNASGWVRYERKITPSTSITDTNTLDLHARNELMQVWDGLKELTLDSELDSAPRIGVDWWLGDDVSVTLTCPRFPERVDADGARVPGYSAVVRAVGWEIDFDDRILTPRLLAAAEVALEAL